MIQQEEVFFFVSRDDVTNRRILLILLSSVSKAWFTVVLLLISCNFLHLFTQPLNISFQHESSHVIYLITDFPFKINYFCQVLPNSTIKNCNCRRVCYDFQVVSEQPTVMEILNLQHISINCTHYLQAYWRYNGMSTAKEPKINVHLIRRVIKQTEI